MHATRSVARAAALVLAGAALFTTGCASYVNSTAGARMRAEKAAQFSHPIIARAYQAKPAMRFPATIALAPQDELSQLQLRNMDAFGKLNALKSLPQIAAVTTVSSLVMSDGNGQVVGSDGKPAIMWNRSDILLREAAAKLHADAVLVMKIETSVTDGKLFAPLSVLTLGTIPNGRSEVIATALAALIDTRTGYVYATAERSAGKKVYGTNWDSGIRERAIAYTGQQALEKLLGEFPAVWNGVVAKHHR